MIRVLLCMVLGFGLLPADTLLLRNGSRIDGTLLNATRRTITFVDSRGDSRSYNVSDVEELVFGDSNSSADRSRTEGSARTGTTLDLMNRLIADIGDIVNHSKLSTQQRQILEDARSVLSGAAADLQENRSVNARDVRRALDNIRYVMNGSDIRAQDRRAVLDDIDMLRDQNRNFGRSNRNRSR
jgi:hypothetical protein